MNVWFRRSNKFSVCVCIFSFCVSISVARPFNICFWFFNGIDKKIYGQPLTESFFDLRCAALKAIEDDKWNHSHGLREINEIHKRSAKAKKIPCCCCCSFLPQNWYSTSSSSFAVYWSQSKSCFGSFFLCTAFFL